MERAMLRGPDGTLFVVDHTFAFMTHAAAAVPPWFGLTGNGTRLAALLPDVNDVVAIGLPSVQGLYPTNLFTRRTTCSPRTGRCARTG